MALLIARHWKVSFRPHPTFYSPEASHLLSVVMPDFIARKVPIDQPQCSPDLLFSFALIGDEGVGKTSLLVQMVEDRFVSEIIPSAANDYGLRMFHSPGKNCIINMRFVLR